MDLGGTEVRMFTRLSNGYIGVEGMEAVIFTWLSI